MKGKVINIKSPSPPQQKSNLLVISLNINPVLRPQLSFSFHFPNKILITFLMKRVHHKCSSQSC